MSSRTIFLSMLLAAALGLPAKVLDAAEPAHEASEGSPSAASQDQPKPAATPIGLAKVGPYEESTKVHGKVDAKLDGVWLMVTHAEIGQGRFKTFPQLLRIQNGEEGPEFHVLDVRLPEDVDEAVEQANKKLEAWEPTTEARKKLAGRWSHLPKYEEKDLSGFIYDKVVFELVSPDQYRSVLGSGPKFDSVLEGSDFSLRVVENYKARKLPPNVKIGQVMQRNTIYAVRSVGESSVKGTIMLGFLTAGVGSPVPLEFGGSFVMYRLAGA
jgi:hypothetical protein